MSNFCCYKILEKIILPLGLLSLNINNFILFYLGNTEEGGSRN